MPHELESVGHFRVDWCTLDGIMTIEDVDWLLRYPCDEIRLTQSTLNHVSAVISGSGRMGIGVQYRRGYDKDQRATSELDTIAGRKITLVRSPTGYGFELMTRNALCAVVAFPENS